MQSAKAAAGAKACSGIRRGVRGMGGGQWGSRACTPWAETEAGQPGHKELWRHGEGVESGRNGQSLQGFSGGMTGELLKDMLSLGCFTDGSGESRQGHEAASPWAAALEMVRSQQV